MSSCQCELNKWQVRVASTDSQDLLILNYLFDGFPATINDRLEIIFTRFALYLN